ncbi:MAG TPA: DEAD/DEAH box helicase [Verrucomicrobiota bacterium]|jgi:superfamily II DNA or RNA helicase|nr:DEAD/DEAH box helicase [Verrucomicrobiota bacterium]
MNVQLRPYQGEAVKCCFALWERKVLNLLLVAAVGAGKTIIASVIMKLHLGNPDKRVLFLAHREELLEQTLQKLAMIDDQIVAGIEQGRNTCPANAKVMVASIATVKKIERIARWCPLKNISLVIIDECHHSTANTYAELLHEISTQNPARHLLGITATPIRMDGENLSILFERLAYRIDMPELIDAGYLCPIRGLTIRTNASIAGVPVTAEGDYDPDKLAAAIDTEARNRVIVQSYLERGENRPAIVFVANVRHAEHLAAEFRKRGLAAQAVFGEQKKEERRQILEDYQQGRLRILTNCQTLTEGYDAPHTSCIIIGRPTRSPVTYPQQIGRGLRLHPSKRDCLVMDLVDIRSQDVITLPKLFCLPENLRLTGENIRQMQRTLEKAKLYHPEVEWNVAGEFTAQDIRQLLEPPDFFHLAQTIQPDTSTCLAWMPLNDNFACVVNVRENRVARLDRDDLGAWHYSYGPARMRLGSKKQEALLDATALLRPQLTQPELEQLSSHLECDGPATEAQTDRLRDYQVPTTALGRLSEAQAACLLQKLDFLKYVYRLRGLFQSGRYAGQAYEAVWLFDPDYSDYLAQKNKFIANRTQPLKVLEWLRCNKPELFESALLPPFNELLHLCARQPNRFHDLARRALEGSPEFLQMQAQHRKHRANFLGRGNDHARKPEPVTA